MPPALLIRKLPAKWVLPQHLPTNLLTKSCLPDLTPSTAVSFTHPLHTRHALFPLKSPGSWKIMGWPGAAKDEWVPSLSLACYITLEKHLSSTELILLI